MTDSSYNVLFLCTGNSARSILAEGLLNHYGAPQFHAYSAGSHPSGKVNPFALEALCHHGISLTQSRSKSWDEFAAAAAPTMQIIITVCDSAAGEVCPIWPGHPHTAHWGVEDPAAVEGDAARKRQAFATAFAILQTRVRSLVALPIARLSAQELKRELTAIGHLGAAEH